MTGARTGDGGKKRGFLRAAYAYDLRYGGRGALPYLGFSLAVFAMGCTWCLMDTYQILRFLSLPFRLGALDIWLFLFRGVRPLADPGSSFQIPAVWIIIQLFILYIVLYYPVRDLNGGGVQLLIRSGRRKSWWTGKLLWSYTVVLAYYLLLLGTVLLFAAGSGGGLTNGDAAAAILGTEAAIGGGTAAAVLLAPVLCSLAFASLELLVSVAFSPVTAFLVVVFAHVLTLFYATPVLFGNSSMMLRSAELGCGTVRFPQTASVCAAVCLLSYGLGRRVIATKDILGSEEGRG